METPKLSPAKINPIKLLPGISISTKKISTESIQEESVSVLKSDLFIIKKQVFKVRDLIQTSTLIKQSELEKKRKSTEKKGAEEQENKLEAKPEKKEGKLKMPSVPKLGFLDRIKNFLFSVLLGYISIKLLPHLPKLVGIVSIIGNVMEFMIDLGGNILDKVVTFIDWGYKAIDATRGFMKSFGGDFSLKIFDTFTGAVSGVIDAAIIASIAIAGQGKDGVLDIGMDLVKDRLLGQGAKTAAQAGTQAATGAGGTAAGGGATAGGTAAQAGGIGTGAVAAIILGAGLLASALGEGAFQLKKMSVGMEQGAKKAYDGEKNPLMKPIRWLMYQGAKFISFQLGTVGTLLDIVGTPFRYAIELIRYPFLDEKGKEAQSKNLAKFDARIREQFREGLNALTFGLVGGGGEGSFGSLFGDKGTKGMGYAKQAEGGPAPVTRGNKIVGGAVKRTISRRPVKRGVKVQVTKVKPGGSLGGKKKIEKIFPEVNTKDKGKNVNPLGYMQSSYNIATKTPSFGALFALPLKAQLGEKPSSVDYMKAAEELTGWMQNTFRGTAGYAGGGKVEAGMFGGEDTTNVIAKSLEENISSKVDAAIKELQKQLMLKEEEKKDDDKKTGPDGGAMGTGEYSPEGLQGEIYKYLLSKGMDDAHAIGLMANISRESGFRPGIDEIGGGGGVGLFQYTSEPRKGNFLKAVPDYKTNWKGQIDYALKEPGEPAPQWLAMKFSSSQEAADWFMKEWERPADEIGGSRKHKEYIASLEKYRTKKGTLDFSKGVDLGTGKVGSVDQFTPIASTFGLQVTSSYRAGDPGYHGKNRARDYSNDGVGRGTPEQMKFAKNLVQNYGSSLEQLIYTPLGFGIAKGKKVGLDYWGASTNAIHYDHVHVAYEEGGETLGQSHLATLGEKGKETVIDADSTKELASLAPNFLKKLNTAETKSQLMKVLQSYMGGNTQISANYGGMIKKPSLAIIAERGKEEFLLGGRTTELFNSLGPNLLEKINTAKTKPQLADILLSATYGGAASERQNKIDAFMNQKGMPAGKGFQGRFDMFGREYDTNTGKLKQASNKPSQDTQIAATYGEGFPKKNFMDFLEKDYQKNLKNPIKNNTNDDSRPSRAHGLPLAQQTPSSSQLANILQSYAPYEDGAEQTVIVMNNPQMVPIPIPTGNSGSIGGMSRSSSIDTTYDIQYANA